MVLYHTVCIKFKKDMVDDAQFKKILDQILSLRVIKGIRSLEGGKNFSLRGDFDLVFTAIMDDKATLDNYQTHELHVKVRDQYIAPFKENIVVVDFEC